MFCIYSDVRGVEGEMFDGIGKKYMFCIDPVGNASLWGSRKEELEKSLSNYWWVNTVGLTEESMLSVKATTMCNQLNEIISDSVTSFPREPLHESFNININGNVNT